MEKQKKIALINDLTGFGRCSTAVMAPIVSAMKIQAVAVPTAILSAHTQFPTYYFDDYTDRMKDYIQTYKDLKLDFDAISTGFLGSEQQVDIVLDFIRHFKTDRNFVIVDPVMGDYGKLYRTYTKEMCDKMKELVHYADIITPNLTELCTLIDAPYPENGASIEELKERGLWFVCADMGGESMYRLDLKGPIGLVIGNEGEGVSRLVREKCDFIASIPMKGDIDSLNASVAAGVLAYEIVRQRLKA